MYLDREDRKRIAGRLLTIGIPGPQLDQATRELLTHINPFGIILFARNIVDAHQLRDFIAELKAFRAGDPFVISVDQEGGLVQRLKPLGNDWPNARDMARQGIEAVRKFGHRMGQELRSYGFDLDYAPVLDIHTEPTNPIIGNRAFAENAQDVTTFACAFAEGLRAAGIRTCGKHYPGHGDTTVDSHLALPEVQHSIETLRKREWLPFKAAAASGIMDAIMTAHMMVPKLDPKLPATLSPVILRALRDELGFSGIIVSDDIDMKALADHWSLDEIALLGLKAGLDHYLACIDPVRALGLHRALHHVMEQRTVPAEQLIASEMRTITNWQAINFS